MLQDYSFMNSPQYQLQIVDQINVMSAIFAPTEGFHEQRRRPWSVYLNEGMFNNISNEIAKSTHFGNHLTPNHFASVAWNALQFSNNHESTQITNGWDERRFRFVLMLHQISTEHNPMTHHNNTVESYIVVQGYTDHASFINGHFDPNAILYFNGYVKLHPYFVSTPYGQKKRFRVVSYNQLFQPNVDNTFTPNTYGLMPHYEVKGTHLIRPHDVLSHLSENNLFNTLGIAENKVTRFTSFGQGNSLLNARRDNFLAPTYLSKVFSCYKKGVVDPIANGHVSTMGYENNIPGHHTFTDEPNTMSSLINGAAETLGNQDQNNSVVKELFFRRLTDNVENFSFTGTVTWGGMLRLFPELNDKTIFNDPRALDTINVSKLTQENVLPTGRYRENTEHWQGGNQEVIWATTLVSSGVSIMLRHVTKKAAITATNRTPDGLPVVHCILYPVVGEIDVGDVEWSFKEALVQELLNGLSHHNQIDYHIDCELDALGSSVVSISLFGNPPIVFASPTFCDGLFSPVTTHDQQNKDHLCLGIGKLMEDVLGAVPVSTTPAYPVANH